IQPQSPQSSMATSTAGVQNFKLQCGRGFQLFRRFLDDVNGFCGCCFCTLRCRIPRCNTFFTAVLPAFLRARNSFQARDPTHRPPFTALTSVFCCQLPASIGPCMLPAFGCVIHPELFMVVILFQ
ncbi:hypothetical protein V5799_024589, partial [Amblyomma americanum]